MAVDQSELDMIRDSIRKITEQFDLEYWSDMDKNKKYPWDFKEALAEGGWLGMLMPEEYGGMGLGLIECGVVLDELGQNCGFNANSVFQYFVFPPGPVIHHGSDEMKQEFLPKLATGEEMMCFAVSEPDNGVDTSRLKTFAKKEGDRYLVNGRKVWISNSKKRGSDVVVGPHKPRNPERPFDGMTVFLTRMKDKKGIEINRIDKIMRNAVDSNEIVFDNFEVFEHEIVGEKDKGFRCLIDGLNPERIAVAQTCIGLGRGALKLATQYTKDRIVFDRPIGQNQAVAHPLAESWMRLEAADLMTQKAARLFDDGQSCGPESNAAKFLASDAGFQAADNAMQFHGGYSMAKEYHISRFWMEARHLKIAPISQQMVLNFISDKVLGLPKSY